ncbi:hemicentin-1-like [Actinia tenebrosa]|uniref:Hemicentin-1-like n=1 Tax=Actinia tenebrosa TaxID=6105 RepID=A0A6P8H8R0_ACTTE|nr:hemicentin-1-like [Actinia tenebrosa]
MKSLVIIPIFLVLLSLFLEVTDSEPRFLRFRFRLGIRRRRYNVCRPVNCAVSGWTRWSHCSQSCGPSGVQTRHRHITRSQKCGGQCNHPLHQSRPCNRFCLHGGWMVYNKRCRCKYGNYGKCCERGKTVNGRWSGWSKWSRCSKTCGYGLKYRTRSCTNPRPSYGGRRCYGISRQSQKCYIRRRCPVNGGWSKWSKWSAPSKTCGIGLKYRTRSCTNPRPANNGRRCYGVSKQYMTVIQRRCTVNGGWSRWSAWSKCSKTCGSGLQVRRRYCTKPKPSYGGRGCSGKSRDVRTCHLTECIHYTHRGCFGDSRSRAMPVFLKKLSYYSGAVAKCAKLASSHKYKCFGVQNGRECWSGPNAHQTYNKYGECPDKCKNGNGGKFANDVYCFRGVPGAPTQAPKTHPPTTEGPKPTQQDCWSEWVYSDCTKPCGCGYKARTRYCKCGGGKYGSCKGLRLETFKCNCHQCGPPIDA